MRPYRSEAAVDLPWQPSARFIADIGTTVLHAMHGIADWRPLAAWEDGVLRRSISVALEPGRGPGR